MTLLKEARAWRRCTILLLLAPLALGWDDPSHTTTQTSSLPSLVPYLPGIPNQSHGCEGEPNCVGMPAPKIPGVTPDLGGHFAPFPTVPPAPPSPPSSIPTDAAPVVALKTSQTIPDIGFPNVTYLTPAAKTSQTSAIIGPFPPGAPLPTPAPKTTQVTPDIGPFPPGVLPPVPQPPPAEKESQVPAPPPPSPANTGSPAPPGNAPSPPSNAPPHPPSNEPSHPSPPAPGAPKPAPAPVPAPAGGSGVSEGNGGSPPSSPTTSTVYSPVSSPSDTGIPPAASTTQAGPPGLASSASKGFGQSTFSPAGIIALLSALMMLVLV